MRENRRPVTSSSQASLADDKGKKQYAGQRFPYVWQSHHIIPQEIFVGEESVFTDIQCDRIRAAGYNINHGPSGTKQRWVIT